MPVGWQHGRVLLATVLEQIWKCSLHKYH